MAVIATQVQETDLIGYLTADITSTATSITIRFVDAKTGAARTPNAATLLFMIDKGNSKAEIVLATSHTTASGVTTLATVTRGLTKANISLAAGTGLSHAEGAECGCVDIHLPVSIVNKIIDGTNGTNANNFRVGDETAADVSYIFQNDQATKPKIYFDDSDKRYKMHRGSDEGAAGDAELSGGVILTTVERDALTAPLNGMLIYNSTAGQTQFREGGAWVTNAAGGTVADASTTVAGKVEEGTVAEQGAATATGGTGARLFVAVANLIKTSAGAGDENKIAILDANGRHAAGFSALGSTTAQGGYEEATVAEQGAATATGSTGARLVPANANLVKTSAGAGDENKLAVLDSAGKFASGFMARGSTTVEGGFEEATQAEVTAATAAGGVTRLAMNPSTASLSIQSGAWSYAVDAAGTDTYVITLTPTPSAYTNGMVIQFNAGTANTGAATLNVNALGAKTIKKHKDQDLETGDIEAGQIVTVTYDGTNFEMQSQTADAPINKSFMAAKGDLITATANDTPIILTVGSNDQVVVADSAQSSGVKWAAAPIRTANIKYGTVTRAGNTASGTQTIAHGFSGTPTFIEFHCTWNPTNVLAVSHGFMLGTGTASSVFGSNVLDASATGTNLIELWGSATASQVATATIDGTNITLTWTMAGAPPARNMNLLWKVYG